MASVFFYGTLRHPPLLRAVLGRPPGPLRPARLADHAVRWVAGRDFPMIGPETGAVAEGAVLSGVMQEDLDRLDFYEGGFGYHRRTVTAQTDAGPAPAEAWFPETAPAAGAPFALSDWAARLGEVAAVAAEEAMTLFGRTSPSEMAQHLPGMRFRASAALRAAATPGPATLRRGDGPEALRITARRRPYSGYFAVEEAEFSHPRFDGGQSETVLRAGFLMGDAVTVLPYDPIRDRVLIVEQVRFGPFVRGDRRLWSLEPIAGRIDPGETPEETARREAHEEAGLDLGDLALVGAYYPSPAAVSEYLWSFVASCDLPDHAAGIGGAAEEHEDIRAHVIPFERLDALIRSGEADTGPLMLSALWLARNRERLGAAG